MKEEHKGKALELGKEGDSTGILQIRLDTAIVLNRIRNYLTGKIEYVVYDDKGIPFTQVEEVAKPKANREGVQTIMSYAENIVNSATVQGNFDEHDYDVYIDNLWAGLIDDLMINLYEWDIKEYDYHPIINTLIYAIIPYISRLKDNKERESYNQTMRVMESQNIKESKNKIFG